jgi:hypothetical protein
VAGITYGCRFEKLGHHPNPIHYRTVGKYWRTLALKASVGMTDVTAALVLRQLGALEVHEVGAVAWAGACHQEGTASHEDYQAQANEKNQKHL